MKVLIAGGAGYIGSFLIPRLIDRGYNVDVVDLLWFGNHLPKEVNIIQKDVFELHEDNLQTYDQVIFLAGLSNDPMAEFSPAMNFVFNASAPAYLGYISKRAGVKRFIYAGSCSVYGYTVNELYDEESPAVSNYPYGISKLQGEKASLQMIDDDLIVNTMFTTAIERNEILVNNPSIWRPILSIEDATNAYIRAIEASPKISGIFNIASGNYTVGEVADSVKSIVESRYNLKIKLNIKNIQDFRNYKVSVEKAINILSFKPKHDVESILENLCDNFEKFKDFQNPNYYNIEVFKTINSSLKF
jgi:nucleoside-diphosphate-sugar epimerase